MVGHFFEAATSSLLARLPRWFGLEKELHASEESIPIVARMNIEDEYACEQIR